MKPSVLVTGSTGFLGSAVLHHLRTHGYDALGVGRDLQKLSILRSQGFKVFAWDMAEEVPRELVEQVPLGSAIVHCAGLSAASGPLAQFEGANVDGTRRLLGVAKLLSVSRFVFVSSSSVCFAPEDRLGVTEDAPLPKPFNAYALTKAKAERLVLSEHRLRPVVLRPRGIYGAGDTTLVPRLVKAMQRGPLPLLRDGRAKIDLTHVDDVCASINAALVANDRVTGQIFNVSSGEVLPISHIVGEVSKILGMQVRWRRLPLWPLMKMSSLMEATHAAFPSLGEPVITRYALALFAYEQSLSLKKARELLGWQPTVSFETGLGKSFPR